MKKACYTVHTYEYLRIGHAWLIFFLGGLSYAHADKEMGKA